MMLASLGRFEAAGTQLYRELFGFSNALGTSPLALPAAKCVIGSDYYIEFYVTLALPWLLGALAVVIKLVSLLRHAHVGMRLICSQVQTNKSHARRFAFPFLSTIFVSSRLPSHPHHKPTNTGVELLPRALLHVHSQFCVLHLLQRPQHTGPVHA